MLIFKYTQAEWEKGLLDLQVLLPYIADFLKKVHQTIEKWL